MGLFAATSLRGSDAESQRIVELEAFIVEETAQTQLETLSPPSVRLDSLFGGDRTVLEIPRAVTVLSPELMELLQIDSYEALDKYGAGTQRVNYFGLAGSAFLRGARAGTYFNGMLRAYQRNEMPMSFGALEGLEVIKGPVPAAFSPTLVGGAVNQRPKSPYFDRARGAVEIGAGSWNERRLKLDYGAPLLLFGKPAAYRVSYTGHRSDRFHRDVPHDFDSLYAAAKIKLGERHRLFIGGEFFDFRSGEAPGVNRPTPELLRDGRYVIGEPPPLTSAQWGGTVARPLLEFPYSLAVNPALFALAVPGDRARAAIAPELLGQMLDLRDPGVLENLYTTRPAAEVPPFAAWAVAPAAAILARVDRQPRDAYLYTPGYFAAGGEVLTESLPRDRILADRRDRADSRDFIAFADLETRLDGDTRLLTRLFVERLVSEKASTYGFAMDTDQLVLNGRGEWRRDFGGNGDHLALGLDLRFTRAEMLQDFDAEPFSRRDISRDSISPNSVVIAGGQRGPDGLNHWSTFNLASQLSELAQAAVFSGGAWTTGEALTVHYGLRAEQAWWDLALPDAVERASAADRAARKDSGDTFLWQAHVNPHWRVLPGVYLYGAAQLGKALAPGDGGTVSGDTSFTDVELLEGGIKASLLDGRLYASLSAYHWDQATFSTRDAAARPLRARGVECEFTWAPLEALTLTGALTAQRVYLRADTLGFGAIPQDEQGWALNAGVLNAAGGRSAPDNPEMAFAGLPEVSAHLYAALDLPGGLRIAGGPLWRDGYHHDMQRAMRIPGHTLWALQLRYQAERWWLRLHVENLLDREYWIGQEPVFSAGTLVLQGPGRRFQLAAGMPF
jgi:iron complex outermembrane recepter protein